MEALERRLLWIGGGLSVVFLALGALVVLLGDRGLPDDPLPLDRDRDVCARCGRPVAEPRFAAQVRLGDGRTLVYDDPGCLFLDDAATGPDVRASWFHHHREDRWIRGDRVGFVPASPTPGGFGLGAADAIQGMWTLEAARSRTRHRHAAAPED